MKKTGYAILCVLLIAVFGLFALASSGDDSGSQNVTQAAGAVDTVQTDGANLGEYTVEILSCRLAKTYDDKPAVIVKYSFTNNSDEPANFSFAFDDNVYQDGIGLNTAYFLDDSAAYSADNQTKDIKTGATIEVEVAYELNDETTDIEVEVGELISWDDKLVTKTFSITQ